MTADFWQAIGQLSWQHQLFFVLALVVAFGFEFINGFHDTANAVTTVIYTKTLKPTPAVLFSGFCNFLGALLGGTAVAFAIVNLLPVDLLIEGSGQSSIIMVMSLLLAGVIWNLGTWWMGLPVSSSHTLIGSIMGVGLANSLMTQGNLAGVSWGKAYEVAMSLLLSPLIGFVLAAMLLLTMRQLLRDPGLYRPPQDGEEPPRWVRYVLIGTCGGVSFAHGSNDGQKGMGLVLLALIGFLPAHYALNNRQEISAGELLHSVNTARQLISDVNPETSNPTSETVRASIQQEAATVESILVGKNTLRDVPNQDRWELRQAIYRLRNHLKQIKWSESQTASAQSAIKSLSTSIEYIPLWVVVCTALALGIGTTIGYKRIVITVAEKIGKTHLTYAQGAAAEVVAATTIVLADTYHLPVSTTQVLSSGIAGTMLANKSGIQGGTIKKILLAWLLTFPACMALAAALFCLGRWLIG